MRGLLVCCCLGWEEASGSASCEAGGGSETEGCGREGTPGYDEVEGSEGTVYGLGGWGVCHWGEEV